MVGQRLYASTVKIRKYSETLFEAQEKGPSWFVLMVTNFGQDTKLEICTYGERRSHQTSKMLLIKTVLLLII